MSNPYIIVSYGTLYTHATIPVDVAPYIDQGVWQELRVAATSASSTANATACCGEILCCLFTGLWCIFCIHPFIVDNLKENQLRQELYNINYTRYNGQQVFTVTPGTGIQINTGVIGTSPYVNMTRVEPTSGLVVLPLYGQPSADSNYGARPAQPVEAYAVPVQNGASTSTPAATSQGNTEYSPSGAVMATVVNNSSPQSSAFQAQASTVRTMTVTLPENIYPYAVIRVQSPEGLQVSVTAPRDARPGQQIQVQY